MTGTCVAGGTEVASRSPAAVGRVDGASRRSGATTRPPAFGGYVPASRDMRGIGRSFKITSEASSPVNKGSPAFGADGL